MNYKELFKDRVIIITGAGRSGTTIAGKIIGSMSPAYYLFEPAIMKLMWPYWFLHAEAFRATLFEDYFSPVIQGRGNLNIKDDSCQANYLDFLDIMLGCNVLRRRNDVMEHIEKTRPYFIIKNPEFQPNIERARQIFPGCKFVHLVRNGIDVVQSSVGRKWYTDDYCNNGMIEQKVHVDGMVDMPTFATGHQSWNMWNAETRAAHAWRVLTEAGMTGDADKLSYKYEWICEKPVESTAIFSASFGIKATDLTDKHIKSICDHKPTKQPAFDMALIAEPEHTKFMNLMEVLGYDNG